jgi:hypothetical protein
LVITLLLALVPRAGAKQQRASPFEPPLVGQPENFSGGVGRFKVTASVSRNELQAEDALVYRIQVRSVGPFARAPQRPDLRKLPRFKSRFVIADLTGQDLAGAEPSGHRWDFHYSLKPRSPEVTEVPPLLLSYYKPGVVPAEKGYWTTATRSIPLTVRPRDRASLVDSNGQPLRAPERFYQFIAGTGVLEREGRYGWPGPLGLALLLFGPPLLAVAWYFSWQRLFPDAGQLALRRRSKAASKALDLLHSVRSANPPAQARHVAYSVETYLRDRFGLMMAVPTPAEVQAFLDERGLPAPLTEKVGTFLRACDAACYAPGPVFANLAGAAERVILSLESEPWPLSQR